ncbi:unnamed protein product, partial [Brassica napus]
MANKLFTYEDLARKRPITSPVSTSLAKAGLVMFTKEIFLMERRKRRPVLNWPKRMKIASGAARELAYLHEDCNPKTIHLDVKAANVLIDDSYEAKILDSPSVVRQCFSYFYSDHGNMR